MIYVILKNRKVLQYNFGKSICIENGMIALRDSNKYLIARFNIDILERVEFEKPCKSYKEKSILKIKKIY